MALTALSEAQIDMGRTEDQSVAAKPLAQVGMKLGSTQMLDDAMVRMSYRSLKGARANPA